MDALKLGLPVPASVALATVLVLVARRCMVFTREYFETEYLPVLVPVALATVLVLAVGLALTVAP